eukprot:4188857-Pleurochrysis_carterae.AAC.4
MTATAAMATISERREAAGVRSGRIRQVVAMTGATERKVGTASIGRSDERDCERGCECGSHDEGRLIGCVQNVAGNPRRSMLQTRTLGRILKRTVRVSMHTW